MSVLFAVRAEQQDGESLWTAAQRALIQEALLIGGDGKKAAKILGITDRKVCFWRRRFKLGRGQENEFKRPMRVRKEASCSTPSSSL